MKQEELGEMIAQQLEMLLNDPEIQRVLANSTDADVLLKALVRTSEFQALLTTVRGISDRLSEVGMSIANIIDAIKSHQEAIKNIIQSQKDIVQVQKAIFNKTKSSTLDASIKFASSDDKPSKPN